MKDDKDEPLDGYDNVVMVKSIEQTDLLILDGINTLAVQEPECDCKCLDVSASELFLS